LANFGHSALTTSRTRNFGKSGIPETFSRILFLARFLFFPVIYSNNFWIPRKFQIVMKTGIRAETGYWNFFQAKNKIPSD
jgi:hypothetical protein